MKCAPDKWIPCALANHKPGSLHRQLHVPKGEKIPDKLLIRVKHTRLGGKVRYNGFVITVTVLLKKRAVLAATLRGIK